MSTVENLIENPDEWEDPMDEERKTRSYKAKITVLLIYLMFGIKEIVNIHVS
jgi:hypothetical protein